MFIVFSVEFGNTNLLITAIPVYQRVEPNVMCVILLVMNQKIAQNPGANFIVL